MILESNFVLISNGKNIFLIFLFIFDICSGTNTFRGYNKLSEMSFHQGCGRNSYLYL